MAFTHSVPSEIHLQAGILPEPGNVPIAADSPDTAFCLSYFILRKNMQVCKSAFLQQQTTLVETMLLQLTASPPLLNGDNLA